MEDYMLSIKESIEQIKTQFIDLFGSDVTDVRLEEIKGGTDEEYYLTVSFLIPNKNLPTTITSTNGFTIFPYIRQYKNLTVNKKNGSIVYMKICTDA